MEQRAREMGKTAEAAVYRAFINTMKKKTKQMNENKKTFKGVFRGYIEYSLLRFIMLAFLLPLASKVIRDAVAQIPENEELGEKLVEICLVILAKAVKLTKTDMDDKLLEVVTAAIKAREAEISKETLFLGSPFFINI